MPIFPKRRASVAPKKTRGISVWDMRVLDILAGGGRKIPLRELSVFCRKFAFLLDAGLPVKAAMPVLAEQTAGRVLSAAVSDLHSLVLQGEGFSGALRAAGVFPAFMCGYIEIGERAANLPEVCARLADYYESLAQTEEELAATMVYPVAVALMMSAVVVLAVTLVLPGYARIFEASGVALPAFTSALLVVSGFLSANIFFVLGGLLAAIFLAFAFLRTKAGKNLSAKIKLKIPIQRQKINCRVTQALSLLLSSGLSISEAIPLCGEITDNPVVRRDLQKMSAQVNSGAEFWAALSEVSYIDPLLVGLARVGEDTGRLAETIEKCDTYFENAYRHAIRRLNKLIEPAITLVLGIILAAVMLAIILPTFELATVI